MASPPSPSTHTSQTLDRGLQILEFLAATKQEVTISQIAQALDVHRTIAHRLVTTLQQRHFVSRSAHSRYRLGTRLVYLAATIGGELRTVARSHLLALNETLDETVHLVVLTGSSVLFVDAVESSKALRVASRVGRSLPAHATSVGKAILATMSDDEVKDLYPLPKLDKTAPKTITAKADLIRHLQSVRSQGFATSFEESEAGVGSVGMAIVDRNGVTRAAISIAAPVSRLTQQALPKFILEGQKAAAAIGEQL